MTTENTYINITAIALATDIEFIESVNTFALTPSSNDLNLLQRDGATAVIDLSMQFADRGYECDVELLSQVIGRLADIQVRDFAMGTHNTETFDVYWNMWLYLLRIAPDGFVAPVACLFATLAYERGDNELAYRALDRATVDDPKYALTILLRRVFGSGWPAAAFAAAVISSTGTSPDVRLVTFPAASINTRNGYPPTPYAAEASCFSLSAN